MSELRTPPSDAVLAAIAAAKESGCRKSRRGAVLFSAFDGTVRTPRGRNYPTTGHCNGSSACRRDCAKICVHAEQDLLIAFIPPQAWEDAEVDLAALEMQLHDVLHVEIDVDDRPIASGPPSCIECSKLMVNAGVAGVWLLQEDGWRRWPVREFHEATLANLRLHRSKQ